MTSSCLSHVFCGFGGGGRFEGGGGTFDLTTVGGCCWATSGVSIVRPLLASDPSLFVGYRTEPVSGPAQVTDGEFRPRPQSETVLRQSDKTYSCHGSRQTLTSPSDSALRLMRTAHARSPSETQHTLSDGDVKVCVVRQCLVMDRGPLVKMADLAGYKSQLQCTFFCQRVWTVQLSSDSASSISETAL